MNKTDKIFKVLSMILGIMTVIVLIVNIFVFKDKSPAQNAITLLISVYLIHFSFKK